MPCSHWWGTAGLSPIAMTRDSHSSDRGRLGGGATRSLKVKPVLAVKIASERSQEHRLGVRGGVRSRQMELLRRAQSTGLGVKPRKPGRILSLCTRTLAGVQCHLNINYTS